jgi:hypothetical protein
MANESRQGLHEADRRIFHGRQKHNIRSTSSLRGVNRYGGNNMRKLIPVLGPILAALLSIIPVVGPILAAVVA